MLYSFPRKPVFVVTVNVFFFFFLFFSFTNESLQGFCFDETSFFLLVMTADATVCFKVSLDQECISRRCLGQNSVINIS